MPRKKATNCKSCNASRDTIPWASSGALCRVCATNKTKEYRKTETGLAAARLASRNYCAKVYTTQEGKKQAAEKFKKYYNSTNGRLVCNAGANRRVKARALADPLFAIKELIRSRVKQSIRKAGYSKTSRTHEMLGASFEEVMQHLNCPNGIPEGYELDHVLPMALAYDEASAIKLNHYTNLQLLTKADNLEKRDKLPDGRNARSLTLAEKKELIWSGVKLL